MARRRQIVAARMEAERAAISQSAGQSDRLKDMGELDGRNLALYCWVLKNGRITARDAVRAEVAQIANADSARDLLANLEAHGWLRQVINPNPGRGRRTVYYEATRQN